MTRRIGYIAIVDRWIVGEPVSPGRGSIFQTLGVPGNRQDSVKLALPALRVLALDLLITGDNDDVKFVRSLIEQVKKLGADLDSGQQFLQQFDELRLIGTRFRQEKPKLPP